MLADLLKIYFWVIVGSIFIYLCIRASKHGHVYCVKDNFFKAFIVILFNLIIYVIVFKYLYG